MTDYYDDMIRQRGKATAAIDLADECRKRDQAIAILKDELRRLRRTCLDAAAALMKPLDNLKFEDIDSPTVVVPFDSGRCKYQHPDDSDRCIYRENVLAEKSEGPHACERPLCPWPNRRIDDGFWSRRNGEVTG